MRKFKITDAEGGAALPIEVNVGASTNRIVGKKGDAVLVDLAVPSDKAKVEQALVALLAETLGLGTEKIAVAAGKSVTKNIVLIMGLSPQDIERLLFTA